MSLNKKIEQIVTTILAYEKAKIAVGLITTGEINCNPYISYPRNLRSGHKYFNVVCSESCEANEIILAVKSAVDVWFLDFEFKQKSFCHLEVIQSNQNIKFRPIFPNRITVEAIIDLLCDFHFKNILIFGHGNLSYATADFMKSCNLKFAWLPSRNSSSEKFKRMEFIHSREQIVGPNQLAEQEGSYFNIFACRRLPSGFFDEYSFMKSGCVIDVSGKGFEIDLPSGFVAKRLDISSRLSMYLDHVLEPFNVTSYGRSTLPSGISVVSGGYIGKRGDLIVDSYADPKYVIGIADGVGGFLKRVNLSIDEYKE